MGSGDVNCTAMNMFSTRKGYVYYKRWPCSTYVVRTNGMIEYNVKSVSPTNGIGPIQGKL